MDNINQLRSSIVYILRQHNILGNAKCAEELRKITSTIPSNIKEAVLNDYDQNNQTVLDTIPEDRDYQSVRSTLKTAGALTYAEVQERNQTVFTTLWQYISDRKVQYIRKTLEDSNELSSNQKQEILNHKTEDNLTLKQALTTLNENSIDVALKNFQPKF